MPSCSREGITEALDGVGGTQESIGDRIDVAIHPVQDLAAPSHPVDVGCSPSKSRLQILEITKCVPCLDTNLDLQNCSVHVSALYGQKTL